MRLISQDGKIDMPYEQVLLGISDQNNNQEYVIYAYTNNPRPYFIAKYTAEAKALKAMDMLRDAYVGLPILFQNVDMNENIIDKLKEWKRVGIFLLHDNADAKIEQVINAIFKFPADSEIEV